MTSNRRLQTNRRTVLKSVTAGTGTVLATTASVIGSAGNRVEVVMEWQGSEPYVTRKVPRKWKQHMDKTKRLAKELTDRYSGNEDVYGFRRVRGDLNRGGKPAPQLGVRVREGSGVKSSLPNERKGVPIEVQEVENNQPAALTNVSCENNVSYDKIKAGVLILANDAGEDDAHDNIGTSMSPVSRTDGSQYLLTANHIFSQDNYWLKDFPCDANWENSLYQHRTFADQYVGDVTKYNEEMDYAMIQLNHGMNPEFTVPSNKSTWPDTIVSHASSIRVGELVQQDTLVEQMGTTTGGTLGEIQADSEDVTIDCLDMKNKGFQCGANVSPGDSGGPVYRPTEAWDGLTMIGLASGTRRNKFDTVGTACNGNSIYTSFFGPPAWDMANHWNLNFSS